MSCGQGVNIAPFARVKSIGDPAALPSLQQPGQVHPSEPFWRQRLLCPGNSGKSRCTESRCPQTRNSSSHINEFTRECLATDVARRMTSEDVLERLSDLLIQRGPPEYIRSDNGPEFTAHRVRDWLENVGVKTLFIEPGSPLSLPANSAGRRTVSSNHSTESCVMSCSTERSLTLCWRQRS